MPLAPSAVGGLPTASRRWSAHGAHCEGPELRVLPLRRRIETELSPPRWPWSAHMAQSLG
eukprot:1894438-Heterocapsa_arctica.AAC.1